MTMAREHEEVLVPAEAEIPAHRGEGKGRVEVWIILAGVRAAQESSLLKLSLRIVRRVRENSSEGAAAQIRSGRQYP